MRTESEQLLSLLHGAGSWHDVDDFVERASLLRNQASQAGRIASDPWERRQLEQLIELWNVHLRRAGEQSIPPDLMPFSAQAPALSGDVSRDAIRDLLRDGQRIRHVELAGIDLRTLPLTAAVFHDCKFVNCILRGVQLGDSQFIHVSFRDEQEDVTRLSRDDTPQVMHGDGAIFKDCLFESIDLRAATFSGAHLDGSLFQDCTMDGTTSFTGAYLVGAKFDAVSAEGTDFSNAILCGSRFTSSCRFTDCDFGKADLTSATLNGAFHRSNFNDADLSKVEFKQGTELNDAKFLKTRFAGSFGLGNCDWTDSKYFYAADLSQPQVDDIKNAAARLADLAELERTLIQPRSDSR